MIAKAPIVLVPPVPVPEFASSPGMSRKMTGRNGFPAQTIGAFIDMDEMVDDRLAKGPAVIESLAATKRLNHAIPI